MSTTSSALHYASRAEYHRWAGAQPRGRYERVDGHVVAMAPERAGHNRLKTAAWLILRQEIAAAGIACEALIDGIAVEVGDATDYQPDVVVSCGERMKNDAVAAPNPVIVVEVLSPSTRSIDTTRKLADYFTVPSVHHYLILFTDRQQAVHHRRISETCGIATRIVPAGRIRFDPPGIAISVEDIYREAFGAA
jgi:Uma2 family endonuclease